MEDLVGEQRGVGLGTATARKAAGICGRDRGHLVKKKTCYLDGGAAARQPRADPGRTFIGMHNRHACRLNRVTFNVQRASYKIKLLLRY